MGAIEAARARIGAQRGELRGWRPLAYGDVAVTALQVLGMARDQSGSVGLRVVVAGRRSEALAAHGVATAERVLRARSVLGPDDPFTVVSTSAEHPGDGSGDDPLAWPWVWLVFHVPEAQLPAIAGLATDSVPTP